jgi:hypothetical protein
MGGLFTLNLSIPTTHQQLKNATRLASPRSGRIREIRFIR